ncbi:unnamed protein product [Arctogadus glacialis]
MEEKEEDLSDFRRVMTNVCSVACNWSKMLLHVSSLEKGDMTTLPLSWPLSTGFLWFLELNSKSCCLLLNLYMGWHLNICQSWSASMLHLEKFGQLSRCCWMYLGADKKQKATEPSLWPLLIFGTVSP